MSVDGLVRRQREYFRTGVTRDYGFRREALRRLLEGLERREAGLLGALKADLGKGVHEAYASEVGFLAGELRHALRSLRGWMRAEVRAVPWMAWPGSGRVVREPYGVALVMGPWNYPLQLLLTPLVGAVAAGNCVVLKPSEHALRTAEEVGGLVGELFEEAHVAVVNGGRELAEDLLKEKFDTIFFTGGTEVGRVVMAAAARHLTPVTLELGGKCPCIVAEDAVVEVAARRIAWGKWMNAGQTCVAPDHVWVHRSRVGELVDRLREVVGEFYGGDPRVSGDYGRIVHAGHLRRLVGYLGDGRVVVGGGWDEEALYMDPTVMVDVIPGSRVMAEEVFGPVLPVLVYDDLGEVFSWLGGRGAALAVYVFTTSGRVVEQVVGGTRSGGVCVNDTVVQILGRELPFGGVGESGMGRYHGRAGYECFSYPRVLVRRPAGMDVALRYPPARVSLGVLKRVVRWLG